MANTRLRDCVSRQTILDMLRERTDHPDAAMLAKDVKRAIPTVGPSSVYRHLTALMAQGLVREIRPDDGPARFDARLPVHAHFSCRSCSTLSDILSVTVHADWPAPPDDITVIAYGTCRSCHPERSPAKSKDLGCE